MTTENEKKIRLIGVLDAFTHEDLIQNPPTDDETMQQLGVSFTNLDRVVRHWINKRFSKKIGKGKIKSDMKFKDLLAMM